MNRRDLFKKLLTKSIDFTVERGEELAEAFRLTSNDIPSSNQKVDTNLSSTNSSKDSNSIDFITKSSEIENFSKKHNTFNRLPSNTNTTGIPRGLIYPPGAIQPHSKFEKKCTGCGDCTYSCPYNAIFPVYDEKIAKNVPYMDVNSNACRMCEDWPCIHSCNFGALKPLNPSQKPNFGLAKGIFDHCINNHTGEKTCNACQEACPIDKTVSFRKNKPIFAKSCTGCGLCVQSCPTFPKAIRVE